MSALIESSNPVVKSLLDGTAPHAARLAAASGLLPLPHGDLLEVLVGLKDASEADIAEAAAETLESQEPADLLQSAKSEDTAATVLDYLASISSNGSRQIHEAVVTNRKTLDQTIATLAGKTSDASLLELISINQQRLVRYPRIIDAILENPARSNEAERRARETQKEFFEKERGAQQIAQELRARGKVAAAEFFETAELKEGFTIDDAWIIAQHIEVSDADLDTSWLPAERYEELSESPEEHAANFNRVMESVRREMGEVPAERVSLIRRVMFMNVKDRMKLAMKGDREARSILIRDSNRVVATAVINNPRVTDQEVESIAAMRTVADEVLRLIAMNRTWARSYPIIHNLVRNPRTPIPTAMSTLPRIRTKDLKNITQNRNVSEAVRRQALRLSQTRSGE